MPPWLEPMFLSALFLAGLVAVVVGVWLIYMPAGVIAAGVLAAVCSVRATV